MIPGGFFIMSVSPKLLITAGTLAFCALTIFTIKVFFLNFPVLPEPDSELWLIDCRIRFTGNRSNADISLDLPSETNGFYLSGTSMTPGFQFQQKEAEGRILPSWYGNPGEGSQNIRYQVRLVPESVLTHTKNELELSAVPYSSEQEKAASDLLKTLDPEGKLEEDRLILKIMAALTKRDLPSAQILMRKSKNESGIAEQTVYLLARKGIAARSAEGIFLSDSRRKQNPAVLLEVKIKEKNRLFDPGTLKEIAAKTFLPLGYDNEPLLKTSGVNNANLSFSVLKSTISAANLNRLRGNLIRHSFLLDISGFNLPLEEQSVFKHLSLFPLAILVIVLIRNIIGLQTMGTFMPVLLALAFQETGLKAGIPAFFLIMACGLAARSFLSKLNLLMVPRISAVVIIVIMLMRFFSILAQMLGISEGDTLTYFPLIIIAWTIERASMVWDEDGAGTAMRQLAVSLLASLPCWFLITNQTLQYFFFSFPEINLFILAVILLIGVYTGYRLTELKRFHILAEK